MSRLIGAETRVNTDGRHYFDQQAAVVPASPDRQLPFFQADATPIFASLTGSLRRAIADEQRVAYYMGNYAYFNSETDLFQAYCLDHDNANTLYWVDLELGGKKPEPGLLCESAEIRSYRKLVAQHPDNWDALNALADLLNQAGQTGEALAYAQKAIALAPANGAVLDTYGWILHRSGRNAEALAALRMAATRLPDHPIVNYHLGRVLSESGDVKGARVHLERARAAKSDVPEKALADALLRELAAR
jgi:tetratricopeptide (TPR) repeat protein